MALQSQNLVMTGLGVLGDTPPNAIQPPLPDGIHLRWSFKRDKGFPWHGYYLFRRRHRPGNLVCLGEYLRELQLSPDALSTRTLNTPRGQIVSDRTIVLTDRFPPPNVVEFDLTARRYLRFVLPPDEAAYQVQVTVGFLRGEDADETRQCIDFADLDEELEPPFSFQDVSFEVFDHAGNPWQGQMFGSLGGRVGLSVGFETHVKLPCPASLVSLSLGHSASPLRVAALDEAGNVVDKAGMSGNIDTVVLNGAGIVELVVDAPGNEAFLFELCYVCIDDAREESSIKVRALAGSVPVVTRMLSGLPGQVVTVTLSFDTITAVEFSGGPAAVIDVCWTPIDRSVLRGWEIVPEFPNPLCLPVAHPDYPCANKPATQPAAEDTAVGRVRYGDPNDWRGTPFNELHGQLEQLVVGGPPPMGDPMANRRASVPGVPVNPDGADDPVMPEQYPLDLVMMGSLNPSIAQMVGLYWVDETADPAVAYDYLILADHDGVMGGNAEKALAWLLTFPDFSLVDGYVVFNLRVGTATPLDPPDDPRVYALPGSTMLSDSGALLEASNNAGLRWDLGTFMGFLLPGKAVMYHLWRADLGNTEPAAPLPPPADAYDLVSKERAVLVVEPNLPPGVTPEFPDDWPPFPLHAIDSALPEGWYSYRVNGIDIFGRHSPHSEAARWFQWVLPPEHPQPWYYRDPPGGDAQRHSYAVGLLDKIAPPPPTAIEAYALDPQDPTLVRDAAYNAWQASLTPAERASVVGLRVRWLWSFRHAQQAPDAQEFRIYFQPGLLNTLLGRITSVSAAGPTESLVVTDIANAHPADAFVDAYLRVGADAFRVVGSQAGTPLRLRVANIGSDDDVLPPVNRTCTVVIPEKDAADHPHQLYDDHAISTNWQERYHVVGFNENVTVTTDTDGNPLRVYEIFLPATGGNSLPLTPSLAEPIVYAHVGVSAVDDKTHTLDAPQWSAGTWGNRPGNEGRVGGPITIFRVWRERPPVPVPPPDSERVFATPADYHGQSFYTYRWQPSPHLKAHVFRALDDAVFKTDWAHRELASPIIAAGDEHLFPVELRGADPGIVARRGQIAAEINQLNDFSHDEAGTRGAMAHYRGLSNDALRVLAGLPWTEPAFTQITTFPLDPDDPELANRPGLDKPPDFPIDPALRIYIDTLDGRSTNRYFYRSAYVDGAHNRSEQLSLSSPPVYLPNVVPPRTPVVTKVLGGDREITLKWASNRELDLAEYRIYRTDDQKKTRDIRLMDQVQIEPETEPDPSLRLTEIEWHDTNVAVNRPYWYRIVAGDTAGNISQACAPVQASALRLTPPTPPMWVTALWKSDGTAVDLQWSPSEVGLESLIQRRTGLSGRWKTITSWLESSVDTFSDSEADPNADNYYRVKVRNSGDNINTDYLPRLVPSRTA